MCPVVGVGVYAAGASALYAFVGALPLDSGFAFVVIQHQCVSKGESFVDVLGGLSPLPVVEIVEGMEIEPDHLYIAPPCCKVTLRDGQLTLQVPESGMETLQPVDVFFQSLAEELQEHSIGVILAGEGADGLLGLEAIKAQFGITAAQESSDAESTDLPWNAVESGLIDIVDIPANLPARVLKAVERLPRRDPLGVVASDPDGSLLDQILRVLFKCTGHDFASYKNNTLYRRIERRMGLLRCESLTDYLNVLQGNSEEVNSLLKELLISVTRFFRDAEVWERIGREVIPALLARYGRGSVLRAWVPACATGEEAYTLCIVFCEATERLGLSNKLALQVFATDLSPRAIAIARRGIYPATIAETMPENILQRYFVADVNGFQVVKKIREMVVFAQHNLLVDPPFSKLDLLSCRNLLIYLSPEIHASVLGRFHYSMNPDGFLVLGSSESVGVATQLFKPFSGAGQIYQRIDIPLADDRFSFLSGAGCLPLISMVSPVVNSIKPVYEADLKAISDRFVLQYFSPTALVTSESGDVLHISGNPERYLKLAEGRANLNIMAMAREGLRAPLSEAFWDALQLNEIIRVLLPMGAEISNGNATVELIVSPLLDSGSQVRMLIVLFVDNPTLVSPVAPDIDKRSIRQSSRLLMLEQLLQQTRATLQATREEMQTSKEELTSTNEELQSTNEELTTSAEELRTMNEELVRARAESEQVLARYTDLFESAPVGYYMLNRSGVIIQVNRVGAEILGWERDRVASGRFVMYVTEVDRPLFQQSMALAYETSREQRCEVSLWRETGDPCHVRISALALQDGQSCRVVAVDITEAKTSRLALQESEESYRMLFEHSYDALLIVVRAGRTFFRLGNKQAHVLFGLGEGDQFKDILYADLSTEYQPDGRLSADKAEEMFSVAQERGTHFFEWTHRRRDGAVFIAEVMLTALTIRGERVIQACIRDITARRLAEDQLQLAAMVYQHSSEAMMVTDADDRIVAVNQAFTELTGYSEDDILGQSPLLLRAEDEASLQHKVIADALSNSGSWQGELNGRRKNGDIYTEWMTINTAFHADGRVLRRVALFSDVSEKKKNEELIWQQANYDWLTGQPNRRFFYDHLTHEIKRALRDKHSIVLMFIDLDRFKEINDTLGHDMGDILLKQAADRLRSSVRESDFLGRLGGDEFAIVLNVNDDSLCTDRIAQKILDRLAQPFKLGDDVAYVSASIGMSVFPNDCSRMEDLLKNADQAMYAAKQLGRNRFSYFTPAMQEAAQTRMRMANDLRSAVLDQQFCVFYQPIVNLHTGSIQKAEALVRWKHPVQGLVSPASFIPVAEETGLIIDIGDWVFSQAVRQVAVWRKRFHPDFQISINKSPVQFRDERNGHLNHWLAQLKALGLPGQAVNVEITETMLMDAGESNLARFQAFRDACMQVSLDDFGTGYSALSYLKKFNIDYLKIDQSFTRNLAPGSDDMALCEAIIVMAHRLQLKVIAEGIETPEQRDLLIAAGCDFGQGFLFARPLPADECEALLTATCAVH